MRRLAPLLVLLLLAPSVAAQAGTPVLVEDLDEAYAPRLVPGTEPVDLRWALRNLDRDTPYFVSVSTPALSGWDVATTPDDFFLQPLTTENVTVTLLPDGRVPERAEFVVAFNLVNSDTGTVTTFERKVVVIATESALVLGVFENPLPPPLDDVWGVFLLDMAFWVAIALVAMLLGDTVVRILAARAPSDTVRAMIQKLRTPVFLLVLAIGVERSFRILPLSGRLEVIGLVLRLLIVGLAAFVAYRIVSAAIDYYASTWARKTSTKLDDVLLPVVRKVAAVALVVVALAYVFDVLGLNPNVIFGAAGIAGLVIAFAAQDTVSNFFSGVFLLLDRPFVEGDDVQIETGEVCRVEHVGLRSTRLYHYRNHEVIVLPNNQLASRKVVNLASPNRHYRMFVNVGVAYGTDVAKVKSVLDRVARAHPDVVVDADNQPFVIFDRFGESSLDFLLIFLVRDVKDRGRVASEVRQGIVTAFAEEGIEIPFPHRTLMFKGTPPGESGNVP